MSETSEKAQPSIEGEARCAARVLVPAALACLLTWLLVRSAPDLWVILNALMQP